jgi:hypothetical protein
MQRQFHYPYEAMFGEYATPYTQPYQSRYHNLGMNGYIQPPRTVYPGKRYGVMGDYGPRQQGVYNYTDVYPLDTLVMESQGIDPNSKQCGLIKDATRPLGY